MNLLDHFHAPLHPRRAWESFHAQWAGAMATALNKVLPARDYYAEVQAHVGGRVEVDVGTFEGHEAEPAASAQGGGTAVLAAPVWTVPPATLSLPAIFPDSVEVQVFSGERGKTLVAAVELASPGNKDRDEERRAFAAKCATYLHEGVGLIVVDVVTSRSANLHNDMIDLMGVGDRYYVGTSVLYANAYHPVRRRDVERIDVWHAPLAVGQGLPVLPLWLDKNQRVPLDLGATYTEACERSRLP